MAQDSLIQWLEHGATRFPDCRAVNDGLHELTYGELERQGRAFAARLRVMGIGDGDRVAVQLPNWVEFAAAYVGILRVRAAIVPIMPSHRFDKVRRVLRRHGARVVVTTDAVQGFDHRSMFRDLRLETIVETIVVVRPDRSMRAGEFDWTALVAPGAALDLGDPRTTIPDLPAARRWPPTTPPHLD